MIWKHCCRIDPAGAISAIKVETLRWSEFESDYFARMEGTRVVKSMKDFYLDIRPKPEYGNTARIELWVCDTPLTVERAAARACYLQAQ